MIQAKTKKQKEYILKLIKSEELVCYIPLDFEKENDWGYEEYDDRIYIDGNITFDQMKQIVEYLEQNKNSV